MSSHIALAVQSFVPAENKHSIAWLSTLGAVNHNWHRALVVRLRADAERWTAEIESCRGEIKLENDTSEGMALQPEVKQQWRDKQDAIEKRKFVAESLLEFTCLAFYAHGSTAAIDEAHQREQAALDTEALAWLLAEREKEAPTRAPAACIALSMLEYLELWDPLIRLRAGEVEVEGAVQPTHYEPASRKCIVCKGTATHFHETPTHRINGPQLLCSMVLDPPYYIPAGPCFRALDPKGNGVVTSIEARTADLGGLAPHEHSNLVWMLRAKEVNEQCLRAIRALLPRETFDPDNQNAAAAGSGNSNATTGGG
eukprot:CAMPEP_0119524730 /NCGR_PEP_ID=MMETSP1344-20130328/39623_1 /TAXON_ID=236787 /ORGANISM="Florenciella parvula, Strain CCMP2471" /LENGTH=311 /DNA_ID=CAMNT_0007563319 /DNA_START=115 /DNA_END=1047 /DNA_ORIENTATION=-